MIKIIRHGDKKICTCVACGCVFTYEKEDVVTEDYGRNEIYRRVKCPDCGEKNNAK